MRSDGLDVPPTKVEPTGSKVGADEHRSRGAACLRPQATGQRGTVGEGALGTAWCSDPGGDVGHARLQTVLNASRFSVRRLCGISPW